ncbi:basic proline-rich protein-like [Columba livia]|uniref:basic proline-rich protein-like n=1 Tax=Columba livia TaxID=8932 RepID=UPI0031BB3275
MEGTPCRLRALCQARTKINRIRIRPGLSQKQVSVLAGPDPALQVLQIRQEHHVPVPTSSAPAPAQGSHGHWCNRGRPGPAASPPRRLPSASGALREGSNQHAGSGAHARARPQHPPPRDPSTATAPTHPGTLSYHAAGHPWQWGSPNSRSPPGWRPRKIPGFPGPSCGDAPSPAPLPPALLRGRPAPPASPLLLAPALTIAAAPLCASTPPPPRTKILGLLLRRRRRRRRKRRRKPRIPAERLPPPAPPLRRAPGRQPPPAPPLFPAAPPAPAHCLRSALPAPLRGHCLARGGGKPGDPRLPPYPRTCRTPGIPPALPVLNTQPGLLESPSASTYDMARRHDAAPCIGHRDWMEGDRSLCWSPDPWTIFHGYFSNEKPL